MFDHPIKLTIKLTNETKIFINNKFETNLKNYEKYEILFIDCNSNFINKFQTVKNFIYTQTNKNKKEKYFLQLNLPLEYNISNYEKFKNPIKDRSNIYSLQSVKNYIGEYKSLINGVIPSLSNFVNNKFVKPPKITLNIEKLYPIELTGFKKENKYNSIDFYDFIIKYKIEWYYFLYLTENLIKINEIDDLKIKFNNLGITFNNNHTIIDKNHIPIVIRTYKRTQTLKTCLDYVFRNYGISNTLIIISIDNIYNIDKIIKTIIEELGEKKNIKIRILFHPSKFIKTITRGEVFGYGNIHWFWLIRTILFYYNYESLVDVPDDMQLKIDGYWFHRSLYKFSKKDPFCFGIAHGLGGPEGSNYFDDIVSGRKTKFHCNHEETNHVLKSKYYHSHFSSITKNLGILIFNLLPQKNFFAASYDEVPFFFIYFPLFKENFYFLYSCTKRNSITPNQGINGYATPDFLDQFLEENIPKSLDIQKFLIVDEKNPYLKVYETKNITKYFY